MEQYDPNSFSRRDADDADLPDSSTGAQRLARLLREMGNASAPDSLLPAIEVHLNLEHVQPSQPAFIEVLTQALRDEQWQVRSTAARMVGTLGDYAPKELVMTASCDQDPRVRAALLHTTEGQVKGNQFYRVAIMALQHDKDSRVRTAAALTLGTSRELVAMKVLEKSLADNDAEVRAAARRSLKVLRDWRRRGEEQAPFMKDDLAFSVQHQATEVVEHMLKKLDDRESREDNENGKGSAYRKMAHAMPTNKTQAHSLATMQIGPYELLDVLGSGGFAAVYRGRHVVLGTEAAIKVLDTSLLEEQVEQFVLEAQIIASLEHPNIVRVLHFDVVDDIPFLVMEYARNGTLRQRHPRGIALSLETVLTYIQQISQALQYAHDRGIIHRDIKPENMLLGQKGEVLLSDFGIAIGSQGPSAHMTKDIMGTILYMAPEQIQGKPTQASDQYALGIVVYEWLSGSYPFEGNLWEVASQQLRRSPPMLRLKAPNITQAVELVVMKALAKDPNQRYESVSAFAQAFSHACEQASSARGRSTVDTKRLRKRRPKRLTFLLILLILISLFASIVGLILSLSYTATVNITPVHVSFVRNYTLSVVTEAADSSKLQVQARFISATAPPQSRLVDSSGTGETEGIRAQGILTFFNGLSIPQTIPAGTRIINADGVQIATDEVAVIPPSDPPYLGSVVVPAHAISAGSKGNIAKDSIDQLCCSDNQSITVKNLSAFSGGQDPQPYTFVQQSDIDRAANLLEIPMKVHAQTLLLTQMRRNEGLLDSMQCARKVYPDHQPNDRVATFRITMTLTCSGEVFDQDSAKSIAIALLKADAAKSLGVNYILTGAITPNFLKPTLKESEPRIKELHTKAQGIWTYQFKPVTRDKLAQLIAGKSEKDARTLLLREPGISRVDIQTPWWVPWIVRNSLPANSNRISLVTDTFNKKT